MEGRVEVCYSGVWGTVCNDLWGRADAAVACRQLGYSSSGIQYSITLQILYSNFVKIGASVVTSSSSIFGRGTGPVILSRLQCTGLEYRLFDCVHRGLIVHSCSHTQDAGVRCRTGKSNIYLYSTE